VTPDPPPLGHQTHGTTKGPRHTGRSDRHTSWRGLGHQPQSTLSEGAAAKTHRPSATKHTRQPRTRSPNTWDTLTKTRRPSVTKHMEHHRRASAAATDTPRTRSPNTRDTSAKTHRPSVTKHTGHLTKRLTHLGLGHHMHGKLRPRLIGHRSPSTWDTSRSVRHTSDSVTTSTGNFGQDTSTGHQAHGAPHEASDTPRTRSPHARETSAKTHRPSVTKHMGHLTKRPTHLGLGHHMHGKLRPRHIGHRSPSTRDTP